MRFASILGHEELKESLRQGIRQGRVAHTQFYLGPRGCGNLALAFAYARYLLCNDRGPEESCGVCTSCLAMEKLAHPDLHFAFPIILSKKVRTSAPHVVDWRELVVAQPYLDVDVWYAHLDEENKQGVIGVEEAQEIVRQLSLRSFSGGYKITLIWYPELMNIPAANKLLKIIEEPPDKTLFLLVGHDASQMLPTILSRTQRIQVPALADEVIASSLRSAFDLDEKASMTIARRSEGDMLRALQTVEQEEEGHFFFFRDWMRNCFRRSIPGALEQSEQFAALGREKQKGLMRYGLQVMRQCMLQSAGAPELVRVIGEEAQFVKDFSPFVNDQNLGALRLDLEEAHRHLERNANPKVLFMDLSYRMVGHLRG